MESIDLNNFQNDVYLFRELLLKQDFAVAKIILRDWELKTERLSKYLQTMKRELKEELNKK